jgi:PAS domain S-box-containing protein
MRSQTGASDPTGQLLAVLAAWKAGDFSVRAPVSGKGIAREIGRTLNSVIELNEQMARELKRLGTAIGKEGKLGQRMALGNVGGGWQSCVGLVNGLIDDLARPVTDAGRVIGAMASGDLSLAMPLEIEGRPLKGEFLRIAQLVNTTVEQLRALAPEVVRVLHEVGTEGKLGGQARVPGAAGAWKHLTDGVNLMAGNLAAQVRSIAEVSFTAARGDLSKRITTDVRGELAQLKTAIHAMIDQLNAFASEVARAREAGAEAYPLDSPAAHAGELPVDVDILIVDDRPENLLAIENILSSKDYNLVRATSGHDALRRILDQDFAVILVDVVMPGMDGFELATIIKQRERSRYTPIIFLTAGGFDISFIYRGYSVGAVDYLMKPLDADVLRAKVAIFVDLFRKDRRIREQAEALRLAERRQREFELSSLRAANEQRYRNLAEAIPQIVWTAHADGAVTYFSRRWYEYTGQTTEEAKGSGWLSAVAPGDVEPCTARWLEGLATQRVFELECRLRRRDGDFGWHLCRAVPERGDDGRIAGWLGTFTDCDVLKRACDAAEKAVNVRDEFLSIASHELRTPLTTLQLRLSGLKDDLLASGVAPHVQRKLDSSLRQGSRLMTLIDNLFDVSGIASRRLTLHREPFDLVDAASEIVERFAEAAASAGVTLELHAGESVPGVWDRLRVEQIIQNLLSNAIKYAPNAPVSVTVGGRDGTATVTVRDHGQGIEPADQERIFGLFERAVSARNYGGFGLGLYIVRANAAAHGGTVSVTSVPADGATFIVELPRTLTTSAADAALPDASTAR